MHLCAIRPGTHIKKSKMVYFDIMLILTTVKAILHCQLWILVLQHHLYSTFSSEESISQWFVVPIGAIEFWMNNSRVHAGPVCGLCEELFVHAVLQAVWNATWRRKTASLQGNPETLITVHQASRAAIKERFSPDWWKRSDMQGSQIIWQMSEALKSGIDGFMCRCTRNSSPDLPRRLLPHLNGGLLAVPGRVRGADQVGGVFKRTLAETVTHTHTCSCIRVWVKMTSV